MITLTIGKMSKRPNSTKRVLTSSTSVTNVTLKENVDIKAPVFKLNFDTSDYNYVIWGDRYYYIDNTVYISNNLWEIRCSLDILATYRDALLGQSCIKAYDTQGPNYHIDDLRFTPQLIHNQCKPINQSVDPIFNMIDIDSSDGFTIFDIWPTRQHPNPGAYIVNCVCNGDINGNGSGPHNWVFDNSEYIDFMQKVYALWTGGPFQGPSARLEAINSIIWVPFNCDLLKTYCSVADIDIANTRILSNKYYFTSAEQIWSNNVDLPIPRIDTDSNVPRFMYNSRWSKYQLIMPSGVVDIDADLLYNTSNISIHVDVDCIHGTVIYKVFPTAPTSTKTYANHILYEGSINYAVDLSWTLQMIRNFKDDVINFTKSVAKVGATIASAYMGGPMAGAAAAKVMSAQNAYNATQAEGFGVAEWMTGGQVKAAQSAAKANLAAANAELAKTKQTGELGQAAIFAASNIPLQLHVPGDISENYNKANTIASVYGANSSVIILSLKFYIDPALVNTTGGTTAKAKYVEFCQKYGYPQPGTLTTLPDAVYPNARLIVVSAVQLSTSSAIGNMDADEVIALETMLKHGVWFEQ